MRAARPATPILVAETGAGGVPLPWRPRRPPRHDGLAGAGPPASTAPEPVASGRAPRRRRGHRGGMSDPVARRAAPRGVRRHLLASRGGGVDARPPPRHEPRRLLLHRARRALDHAGVGLRRRARPVGAELRAGGVLAVVGGAGRAHRPRRGAPQPRGGSGMDLDGLAVRGDRGGRHALSRRPAPDVQLLLPGPAPVAAHLGTPAPGVVVGRSFPVRAVGQPARKLPLGLGHPPPRGGGDDGPGRWGRVSVSRPVAPKAAGDDVGGLGRGHLGESLRARRLLERAGRHLQSGRAPPDRRVAVTGLPRSGHRGGDHAARGHHRGVPGLLQT